MVEKIKGTVRACTEPKEWNEKIQIGFNLQAEPKKWYNIQGEEKELKTIRDTLLKKGNEIEFNIDFENTGEITDLKVVNEANEKGFEDEIVNFETLLTDAHEKGLDEIKTEMLEINLEKKYALFKATVHGKKGWFSGHGDATAENVTGEFIKPHFIRMAETRAICRALRWYTNNAECSDEEKK